jgi:Ser/Thr protein kinase RdoA (MazF antagonist)
MTGPPARLLSRLGLRPASVVAMKDVPLENSSWLAQTRSGERCALRRYHAGATAADLQYEHAVLRYLAGTGWAVPDPVSELIADGDRFYCLTRYVPGHAVGPETARQSERRGGDLARLHLALRGLGERLGQRPGFRPQHAAVTAHADIDWEACARGLTEVSPAHGARLRAAADRVRTDLAAVGAAELPLMVVHGDFAEWNVHYARGRLAGVIDFGLTHLDSRPYELAIARTWRAPEAAAAYRAVVARHGWALSELEEAAIGPVYRAFRVSMAADQVRDGLRAGQFDLPMIERQIARAETPAA